MKKLLIIALAFLTTNAHGAIRPYYNDIKLPTQKMVEYQLLANLSAASSALILTANAGPTSAAAVSITTFGSQPDVPRIISITPGFSTGDVAACVVTLTGTDILNNAITEDVSFLANASTVRNSLMAFKTITQIDFAASCEDAPYVATWYVGIGESVGAKRCMSNAGAYLHSALNGAKETTAAVVVADEEEVSKNVFDFNGTMNGTNDFEVYFMQNFQCTN